MEQILIRMERARTPFWTLYEATSISGFEVIGTVTVRGVSIEGSNANIEGATAVSRQECQERNRGVI